MKSYLLDDFDYERVIDFYDEVALWSAPFGLQLLDKVIYKPNINALDIGCGLGFPLVELAMRLGEGSMVYGIDPWKEAAEKLRRRAEHYKITNIKLIEGFAESIPLGNESIDLIVSNNGLNNVQDLAKVLAECSRILKPGGQFIATMNTDKSMLEFYKPLQKILFDMELYEEIKLMKKHIYEKRKPLEEIESLYKNAGLTINNISHEIFCYKFATGKALFSHYFIRLAFLSEWKKFLPVEKLDYIFDTIENQLNEEAKQSNGVKLSVPFVVIEGGK